MDRKSKERKSECLDRCLFFYFDRHLRFIFKMAFSKCQKSISTLNLDITIINITTGIVKVVGKEQAVCRKNIYVY